MVRFRSSRGTIFKARIRERKNGYYEVSVPKYVVERENIAKKKVHLKIEDIQEDD